jgi:hypothetical protein
MQEKVTSAQRRVSPWRIFGWGVAVALIVAPLIAMQFTGEVNWTAGDFIFAALLIGIVGTAFELTVRVTRNWPHRAAVAAALAAAFLTVWVNGAVGMIGDEGNAYNLLFLGVIALALLGSALARFRPRGMALAMAVAALAQALLGFVGMGTDLRGGIFSTMFAGIWLLSAALFRMTARDDPLRTS